MHLKNPHDKFFKETFGDVTVAGDFLINYLPESVLEYIDIDTLDPQKDSFIDEKLEETFSDLLFKADIAGNEGYIYFLFEHKSYPDKGIVFQVLRYMVEIWEAKLDREIGRLPIVIPLVVYHGKTNWRIPSSLGSILNGYDKLPDELKVYIPNFDYLLYDLSRYSDDEIKGVAQTKIGLTLLRDIFSPDTEKLLESFFRSVAYLNELEDRQTGVEYFETMIRYILGSSTRLTKKDMEKMIQRIETVFPEGSDMSMTLADILREEGIEIGMEKGMEIGGERALADMATRILVGKFKRVPADVKAAIQKLDTPTLQELIMKIITFEKLDEIREYL